MQPEAQKAFILEIADRVVRSWWTVVAGICLGLAGAFLSLNFMPKVYEASTKIWVAEQQIPEDVIQTTITDDWSKRLLAFRETLLDQPYMVELIERTYGLPEDEEELRDLIREVRRRVAVDPKSARRGLKAFHIIFTDGDPARAAKVVNTLTELYINQNEEFRSSQAKVTAKTIEKMAQKAKAEFDEVDRKLNQFNQKHSFETEAQLQANLKMREGKHRELELTREKQQEVAVELRELESKVENYEEAGVIIDFDSTVEIVDPLDRQIAALQRELADLRLQYSELHPTIVKKKRQLDDLLASAKTRSAPRPGEPAARPADPLFAALQEKTELTRRRYTRLVEEESSIRREIAKFERRIEAVPAVQQQLSEILEERSVLLERFRKLQRDSEGAKGSRDLEESEMGEKMEILEMAHVPRDPISPQPMKIYAVGLVGGLLLFVGPIVILGLLNPMISSEAGLASISDVPILVTMPTVQTPENKGQGRRRFLKNFSLSLASSSVLAAVIAFISFSS